MSHSSRFHNLNIFNPTALLGINQLQWALEFMKCMKTDYTYPTSMGNIVKDLEIQMIQLYSQVAEKLQNIQLEKEKNERAGDIDASKS